MKLGILSIDPVAYGSQGNAILGIRDSGKTYTATVLAEQLFDAGIPFIAFDPIGVWRFLRVPGQGKGYPIVVAGGKDGDLALTPDTAPQIVEAAMENGISLVIDLFDINLSKADWRKIVRESVRLLLHKNGAHGLRHVFIEEAAEFAPQKVTDGLVYAEIEKLARMGGNSRLGYTLINQRAEEVNKALLELCDNLFLHRQKGKNSLTSLGKWLDLAEMANRKEIIASLPTLPQGECWAWLEAAETIERIHVQPKASFHPDRRAMRGDIEVSTVAVDVGEFVEKLRASLADVPVDQETGQATSHRIADLERQLVKERQDTGRLEEIAYRNGLKDGRKEGVAAARNGVMAWFDNAQAPDGWTAIPLPETEEKLDRPVNDFVKTVIMKGGRRVGKTHEASLHAAGRKMLGTIVQHHPAKFGWTQIATLSGLKPRGGHFNSGRKSLLDSGYVEGTDLIGASEAGIEAVGGVRQEPHTKEQVLAMWLEKLPGPADRMLETIAKGGIRQTTWDDVAAALSLKPMGGHWNTGRKTLRDNSLIEETSDGRVRVNELFR